MEVSGTLPGQKAILNSPYFHGSGPQCSVRFWYHMYGASVDKLELGITHDSDMLWRSSYDAIWTKQGRTSAQTLYKYCEIFLELALSIVLETFVRKICVNTAAISAVLTLLCSLQGTRQTHG